MGNQESISSDKYVVRKKQHDLSNKQPINKNPSRESHNKNNREYQQQSHKQHQHQLQQHNNRREKHDNYQTNDEYYPPNNKPNYEEFEDYQYNQRQYLEKPRHPPNQPPPPHSYPTSSKLDRAVDRSDDYYEQPTAPHNRATNKNHSNNAIMQRGMMHNMYQMQNKPVMFDYPSNSNDMVDNPKPNFDNLEFTPFNFNDEVSTFKKNMKEDKIKFEESERQRRKRFEKEEEAKNNFLQEQIKNFELKYNPWEILGLKYKDYNVDNIKKAYKKSALKHHPDRGGDKDKFQLITQAYIYLLNVAEEKGYVETKINRPVVNMDYEDDINDQRENIYVSKDKFDINQFNQIFEKYKVPSVYDKGYSDLMKEDIKKDSDEVFGQKFNKDIFNAHFDSLKTKKSNALTKYQEPDALDSSLCNLNQSFLGMDDVEDFGSVSTGNLAYTDYKKAHVDETMLIDVSKVKYKTYKSKDDLESDRARLSYTPTVEDRQRYEYMERKRAEDDNLRIQKQREHDEMIGNHYNKINRRLIIHK